MNLKFAFFCVVLLLTQSCHVQSIREGEGAENGKRDHAPILLTCNHHSTDQKLVNCLHYKLQQRLRAKIAKANYIVDIKGVPHVEVGFTINEQGHIENIQALNGHQRFFEIAEEIVRELAIDLKNENALLPAYHNNKPTQKRMVVNLLFK